VCGDDDTGRACTVRRAADRAEVAWVGHPIEDGQHGPLDRRELVGVGVAIWLDHRDHSLVVARPGPVEEVTLELELRLRLAEPRLGLDRALGCPELEHLAPAAQRFPHRPTAVDQIAAHGRVTSV
jgi:hypothetical protein